MEGDRESMEEGRKCGGASVLNEVYRVFSYNQKKPDEVALILKRMVPNHNYQANEEKLTSKKSKTCSTNF